ncbi:MAG: hypothetical protein RJA70_3400, partial [Pseudomonadota bacterium]
MVTLFKHAGKGSSGKGGFAAISSKLRPVPAWMDRAGAGVNDTTVVSLKPPRIPSGLGPDVFDRNQPEEEYEEGWGAAQDDDDSVQGEQETTRGAPPADFDLRSPVIPEMRRIDTLIEEIIPRVDEEAVAEI